MHIRFNHEYFLRWTRLAQRFAGKVYSNVCGSRHPTEN